MEDCEVVRGTLAVPMPPAPPAQWPPPKGRKRFPEVMKEPTLVSDVAPRAAKKVFTPQRSEDIEARQTPGERRRLELLLSATPTGSLSKEEDLVFLSGKRNKWRPTGTGKSKDVFLREDQFVTAGVTKQPHPPVAEPSPRLLRGLKRKQVEPIKRRGDGVKASSKAIDRLYADHERRESRKKAEVDKLVKADNDAVKVPRRLQLEEQEELVQRQFGQALSSRQSTLKRLEQRFAPEPPRRKLTKEQQAEASKRLYDTGVERQKSATARAVDKYIESRRPQTARISHEEAAAASTRLSTPRQMHSN
jgi:hypothetical protein